MISKKNHFNCYSSQFENVEDLVYSKFLSAKDLNENFLFGKG